MLAACPTPAQEMLELNESFDALAPWTQVHQAARRYAVMVYRSMGETERREAWERHQREDRVWREAHPPAHQQPADFDPSP